MKTCKTCHETFPLSGFHIADAKENRYRASCIDCTKAERRLAYLKRKFKDGNQTVRLYKDTMRRQSRILLIAYLNDSSCGVCGETDPIVLEFHHRNPAEKSGHVGKMVNEGYTPKSVAAEIAKCDVLCANCHRRETARQFGWINKYKCEEVG